MNASSIRRWFVTGGSSGIGRALIEHALSDGDAVVATVRKDGVLSDLQSQFPALQVEILDVRDRAAISEVVSKALASGPVDIVVNNAGYGVVGAAEELTLDQYDDQIQTMLLGPIAITRAFLPSLRENGGGHIIQMSSVAGQTTFPGASAYHAAKWGLEGFSESVATEVGAFGIHITLVEPGAIRTGFGNAVVFAEPLSPYDDSPVADFRRFAAGGDESYTGDPVKVASIIVGLTRMPGPPLRLALGEDAVSAMEAALQGRLHELGAHRALSCSVALAN